MGAGRCAILVVLSQPEPLEQIVTLLRADGVDACGVRTFEGGRDQLNRQEWNVVLTEVRLGAYNGLHLAARARTAQPDATVIITGDGCDPAVEAEASLLKARYIATAAPDQLCVAVLTACGRLDAAPLSSPASVTPEDPSTGPVGALA
jgi:DNA-binding NtrC family response regulator